MVLKQINLSGSDDSNGEWYTMSTQYSLIHKNSFKEDILF